MLLMLFLPVTQPVSAHQRIFLTITLSFQNTSRWITIKRKRVNNPAALLLTLKCVCVCVMVLSHEVVINSWENAIGTDSFAFIQKIPPFSKLLWNKLSRCSTSFYVIIRGMPLCNIAILRYFCSLSEKDHVFFTTTSKTFTVNLSLYILIKSNLNSLWSKCFSWEIPKGPWTNTSKRLNIGYLKSLH